MLGSAKDEKGQQLEGNSKWFYKSGVLQSEGYYKNGRKTGAWKRYDQDGNPKPDRHYSNINMNTIVFNSALRMPKANGDFESFESYIIERVIQERAFEIVELSPIAIQLVVTNTGQLQEIKYDNRLSNHTMSILDQIVKEIPSWQPGSNGTQNINVRVDYQIEFPTN